MLIAAAALAMTPAAASGATVTSDGASSLSFNAGPGEKNSFVGIAYQPGESASQRWFAYDDPIPPTAGTNCTASGHSVSCAANGAAIGTASVDLGDNDDAFFQIPISNTSRPGSGPLAPIALTLLGGTGADIINVVPDGARKTIDGGDGNDDLEFKTFSTFGAALPVSPGEYQLSGGEGADRLAGAIGYAGGNPAYDVGADEHLIGGPGTDRIDGFGGNDRIDGGDGDDGAVSVEGGVAAALSGGPGDDTVDGGTGNDGLDGGPGSDTLIGGVGDDLLYDYRPAVADGADSFSCGDGNDTALPDQFDTVALDCELVGTTATCSAAAQSCSGTVDLDPASGGNASVSARHHKKHKKRKGALGRGTFKLGAGATGNASAKVSNAGRSYVSKHKQVKSVITVTKRVKLKNGKVKTFVTKTKATLKS